VYPCRLVWTTKHEHEHEHEHEYMAADRLIAVIERYAKIGSLKPWPEISFSVAFIQPLNIASYPAMHTLRSTGLDELGDSFDRPELDLHLSWRDAKCSLGSSHRLLTAQKTDLVARPAGVSMRLERSTDQRARSWGI